MVVYCNRQKLLGLVLSDDVLVEIFLYLCRLRHIGKFHIKLSAALTLATIGSEPSLNHNLICLLCALVADKAVESGNYKVDILFCSSAETAYFLWHCYITSF